MTVRSTYNHRRTKLAKCGAADYVVKPITSDAGESVWRVIFGCVNIHPTGGFYATLNDVKQAIRAHSGGTRVVMEPV